MAGGFGTQAKRKPAINADDKAKADAERKRWREALAQSPAFAEARGLQDSITQRIWRLIARIGHSDTGSAVRVAIQKELAPDHLLWVEACGYALASQLMSTEQVAEANGWARYIQTGQKGQGSDWFDEPGRWAVAAPTGTGKSVACCALMTEVVKRHKGGASDLPGVVYCASNLDLLAEAWHQLRAMDADMGYVAMIHSEGANGPAGIPVTELQDLAKYPVVLCSQQRIARWSQKCHTKGKRSKSSAELRNLLEFDGRQRIGLWDEAFHSADVAALDHTDIASAISTIVAQELPQLAEAEDQREALQAIEQLLAMRRRLAAIRSGASRATRANRKGRELVMEALNTNGLRWLEAALKKRKRQADAETLRVLRVINGSYLQVFSAPPVTPTATATHLVQPVAKVDPSLERVLILDASYRVSLLSASDHTVKESRRLSCPDVRGGKSELVPKRFDQVVIHLCRGPSGRTKMEDEPELRRAMIQRQVGRILRFVPESEPFLVCTFVDREKEDTEAGDDMAYQRKAGGKRKKRVDWIKEIQREMTLRGVANWEERASFVTWGKHRGRNTWRHIKYGFAFGITQRMWSGDLHLKTKALEGDLVHLGKTKVANASAVGPQREIAADIQQLIGRLHCRNTFRVEGESAGQSGETEFWLEAYEPGTNRPVPLDGEIAQRLADVMPGVRFTSGETGEQVDPTAPKERTASAERKPAAPSAEQRFTDAALEWVANYRGSTLNTADLTAGVRRRCTDLVETVSPKTLARGVAKAKQQLVASGRWESVSARRLKRSTSAVAA